MLLAAGWQGHKGLTLLTGGEAVDVSTASALLARAEAVWNLYGPTEATIWATAAELSHEDIGAGEVPIGLPVAHVEAHLRRYSVGFDCSHGRALSARCGLGT
jgi:non-ribosomal peptide synthetase component F